MQRIVEFWTGAWQLAAENQKAVMEQWQSTARASGSLRESATQPERKEPPQERLSRSPCGYHGG
jgi:hypothetical protein